MRVFSEERTWLLREKKRFRAILGGAPQTVPPKDGHIGAAAARQRAFRHLFRGVLYRTEKSLPFLSTSSSLRGLSLRAKRTLGSLTSYSITPRHSS